MSELRHPRRTREELHAAMLDAGRSILLEQGLGTRADGLTFKHAFERVEADTGLRLTNASVIGRLWKNQADYQLEVLISIAMDESRAEIAPVIAAVVSVLDGRDLSSASSRADALREICRVGGEAHGHALRASASWSLWINLWAMATSSRVPARQHRLHAALMEGYEALNRQFEEAFGGLMLLLGIRAREPLTTRHFANAVGALAEGCSLRDRVDGQMAGILRPTGPKGEDQAWTVFAIGLEAIAHQFFEPDPAFGD
jgi:hypothetical protein